MTNFTRCDSSVPGIFRWCSKLAAGDVVIKQEEALRGAGFTLFARIDHSLAARQAGLDLPPCMVIVFGKPSSGTLLMQAAPSLAIDLPSRILVREDGPRGSVIDFNSLVYLAKRHHLGDAYRREMARGFDQTVCGLIESCLSA